MSRITARLTRKGNGPARGFIPFITAGDPNLDASLDLALALADGCADVLEIGVPFSDPVADGPVIQRSSLRALQQGVTLRRVIELVARVRQRSEVPVVLFSYFNPVLQYGVERFAKDAAGAGVDGLLLTDLTPEESGPYLEPLRRAGLDTVFLAAPTTTPERMQRIAAVCSGFLYLISRAGVTGQQEQLAGEVEGQVQQARRVCSLPVAVGFGISRPEHVRRVWDIADAAVVGSALVQKVEDLAAGRGWLEETVAFARRLKGEG